MTTESFRKGRFTISTIPDDELPEGFLETSIRNPPPAGSRHQSQQSSSKRQSEFVDSLSGSSRQKDADAIATRSVSSVESSTEFRYVEPIVQIISPAGIQISTSDGMEPSGTDHEQVYTDENVEQQATEASGESGSVKENVDDSVSELTLLGESNDPILGPERVVFHRSEQTVCFGRCGMLYQQFAKKLRNSMYWLVFLCLLVVPTISEVTMGMLYKEACEKPFDISKLSAATGTLGLICLSCHITTVAFKLFGQDATPVFKVISIITIVVVSLLRIMGFAYFPQVDVKGSCEIIYNYMLYMNSAYFGVLFVVATFHLDLLYYACFPKYNCMSSTQTED